MWSLRGSAGAKLKLGSNRVIVFLSQTHFVAKLAVTTETNRPHRGEEEQSRTLFRWTKNLFLILIPPPPLDLIAAAAAAAATPLISHNEAERIPFPGGGVDSQHTFTGHVETR